MSISRLFLSLLLGSTIAACGWTQDLGETAQAFNHLGDAGVASSASTDAGCAPSAFDPLLPYALGVSQPEEAAWIVPAGEVNVPVVGPGLTNVLHATGDGWWIWLSFGEPPVDGELPRSLGRPSCAEDDARLFAVPGPDGGGRFLERPLHAHVHVVDAGTEPGALLELELTELAYEDVGGAVALPDQHLSDVIATWSNDGGG
ncbi:MAG: hypothetical protein JST54_15315 [Deltaproteobacteria bacterium]|nr:hypothetical protein [Deltaproteobacteria bacterium]